MLRRWKNAVLVTWLTWDWKERVESRMTPRLRTEVEGETVEPSMFREKLWKVRVRESGPINRISDLLPLSFMKLICMKDVTSVRQAVRVAWVVAVMVVVGR